MAKTLAQGRKPGSGRKPGRAKTLAQGRKPGSGRRRRDTVSGEMTPARVHANSSASNATSSSTTSATAIPIPGAERPLTSRDMEAVDALRELTYSPQFSPPTLPLPLGMTLPPLTQTTADSSSMMGMMSSDTAGMPTPVHSRSFPAISRILSASPPPQMQPQGLMPLQVQTQGPTHTPLPLQTHTPLPQIHSPPTPSPFILQSPTQSTLFPGTILSPTMSGALSASASDSHAFPQGQGQGHVPAQMLSPPLPPIQVRPLPPYTEVPTPGSTANTTWNAAPSTSYTQPAHGVYLPSLPLSMLDHHARSSSGTPPPPPQNLQPQQQQPPQPSPQHPHQHRPQPPL